MAESASPTGIRIHAGRFYRLLRHIGPIPAGIYRGEGSALNEFHFSVGDDRGIRFSLENIDSTLISQVTFRAGKAGATRQEEFISRYFSSPTIEAVDRSYSLGVSTPRLTSCTIRFTNESFAAHAPLSAY
jgi:hypothetical protein